MMIQQNKKIIQRMIKCLDLISIFMWKKIKKETRNLKN